MDTLPSIVATQAVHSAPPRPPARSLATKILVGLILNLVGIGAIVGLAFNVQLRLKPDWLLAGRAGDRLQAAAELIADDLARVESARWDEVLDRFSEAYRLQFMLFDPAGKQINGPATDLPPEVQRRLTVRLRGGAGPGPGLGGGRGPGASGRRAREAEEAGEGTPTPVTPFRGRRAPAADRSLPRAAFPRFVMRAGEPPVYWVVLRLPVVERSGPGPALVAKVDSLWRGGLFLDVLPWAVAGLGAISISALLWLPFVRRITRDMARMTRQTEVIAAGNFDTRLHLPRHDELGRLADAIDSMAARLADQVAGQRRFLGDAAHELCSPLARLQAAVAILEEREPAEKKERLRDLSEELEEMAALVHELLAFSKASHGKPVRPEPVDVSAIAARAWQRESGGSGTLQNQLPDHARVLADPSLLARALSNLFRNALRYAGEAGPITLSFHREGAFTALTVSDEGPGVPPETLPRLFEPFFRPESSRSREFGGAGLGLAIVKTCVDACGGTVSASNLRPKGFAVTLRLPAA